MKASELARGYLAVKPVELPLCRPASAEGSTGAAPVVTVGLRPLDPGEEGQICARALGYARALGAQDAKDGDELVEYGKAIHRCLLGAVDADSPPGKPEPFFDGGLAQLERMVEIGKDGILTLAEMHQAYTDEISGLTAELADENSDGFQRALEELAGPRGGPFWFSLRPGLRATLSLSMARLLLSFLHGKSSSGSAAESDGSARPNGSGKGSLSLAPEAP